MAKLALELFASISLYLTLYDGLGSPSSPLYDGLPSPSHYKSRRTWKSVVLNAARVGRIWKSVLQETFQISRRKRPLRRLQRLPEIG